MNAGPPQENAFWAFCTVSLQLCGDTWATKGMLCATMIWVRSLENSFFPDDTEPGHEVVVCAPMVVAEDLWIPVFM